jgi:hypothetical protein
MDNNTRRSLRELVKGMQNSLPFMEGCEKGDQDDIIGEIVTVKDYGFMKNDGGQYVAYVVAEYPDHFFFGGSVMTDYMEKIEELGMHDAVCAEGLPMLLTKKKAKDSGRTYTSAKFYPEG